MNKYIRTCMILGAGIMIMLANLDVTIVNLAIPRMSRYFNEPITHMQWVLTSYYLGSVSSFMIGGIFADKLGKKRVFLFGTLIFCITSLIIGVSDNLSLILMMRFLQGTGFALTLPLAIAIIRSVFPEAKHGLAVGIAITTTGVSQALGPTVGGVLLSIFSWRFLFLINVPLCVISIISIYFLYHLREVNHKQHHAGLSFLKLKIFNNIVLVRAIYMAVWSGALFFLPVYMQNILHFSVLKAGMYLLIMTAFIGIGSPITGKLIDRFGAECLISISLVLLLGSIVSLYLGVHQNYESFFMMGLALFGISVALFLPSSIFAAMKSLPAQVSGRGMGFYFTLAFFGSSVGVYVAAHLHMLVMLFGIYILCAVFMLLLSCIKFKKTSMVTD